GFLLNNELTDFSAVYEADDPNRPQAYARPRSSMSPTIVLDDGDLKMLVGSPGGSTIITTVLQVMRERLDPGLGRARDRAGLRHGGPTAAVGDATAPRARRR